MREKKRISNNLPNVAALHLSYYIGGRDILYEQGRYSLYTGKVWIIYRIGFYVRRSWNYHSYCPTIPDLVLASRYGFDRKKALR